MQDSSIVVKYQYYYRIVIVYDSIFIGQYYFKWYGYKRKSYWHAATIPAAFIITNIVIYYEGGLNQLY